MAKKNFSVQSEEKSALGKLISKLRIKKNLSLRKFAAAVGLSPSNMTYIEKGTNVPTADVYERIIRELNPKVEDKIEMDKLFCKVRKIPTPEVCQVILNNYELGEKIKGIGDTILTTEQLKLVEELFESFSNTWRILSYYACYDKRGGCINEDILFENQGQIYRGYKKSS